MRKSVVLSALGGAALIAALVVLACDSSDTIPPADSKIKMSATPSTIILSGGVQAGDITVLATIRNAIGVPLPSQDVRFTTSSGVLNPTAGTSVEADANGNATSILSLARQSATVTATAGSTSEMLQLNTATCELTSVNLNVSQVSLDTCNDTFQITATAIDTGGNPCVGVQVRFLQIEVDPDTDVTLQFNPGSATSDALGQATSTLSVSVSSCQSRCEGGNLCTGQFEAAAGAVMSVPIDVVDNVN